MIEAQRLLNLPTYVFAKLDELKDDAREHGVDLIDLGMGNPDLPTPAPIVDSMTEALREPSNLRYPNFDGTAEFRAGVSNWYQRKYGVMINPGNEVLPLNGSKEGLVHLVMSYINPGDIAITITPSYPAHTRGIILAGGLPYTLTANRENGFMPDVDDIDEAVCQKARLFIISYPSNPLSATATREYFERIVDFCKRNGILLVHDFAYAEIYFNETPPISMLSIPGAGSMCIEFNSFSKTFSMAGFRAGFAVGSPRIISVLKRIKTNLDYGLFMAIQKACVTALNLDDRFISEMRQTYKERRNVFAKGLARLGWAIDTPQATMYFWIPVPRGYNSTGFCMNMIEKTGVVAAPGNAFGNDGEGFVRFSLIENTHRLNEAIERMDKAKIRFDT